MNSIDLEIRRIRRTFVGNYVNFKYQAYNISGKLEFVGISDLCKMNGSTYITVTIERLPIRISQKNFHLVEFQIVEMYPVIVAELTA